MMLKSTIARFCPSIHDRFTALARSRLDARQTVRHALLVGVVLALTGCSNAPVDDTSNQSSASAPTTRAAAAASATPTEMRAVLHIISSIEPAAIRPLLQGFAKQHEVDIRVVTTTPRQLVATLSAQPADIVLSSDTDILQQAAEGALLQPFNAEQAADAVPDAYLDPDGNWLPLSYHARTAVYDGRWLKSADIGSFASLAAPKWAQKLCLTSAQDPANQALVAQLIHDMGETKTRSVLQGWLANLARPPFADDDALLAGIARGECQVGLVDSQHFAQFAEQNPNTPLALTWINASSGGVPKRLTAIAMARASQQPELALQLIEWLAKPDQQSLFASLTDTYPIHPQAEPSVRLKAWGDGVYSALTPEQSHAGLANAKMLMDDVGYR